MCQHKSKVAVLLAGPQKSVTMFCCLTPRLNTRHPYHDARFCPEGKDYQHTLLACAGNRLLIIDLLPIASNPLQVLSCYAQMASGREEDVEAALKQLLQLAGQQRDSVPVLLALASGFMLKKQIPKAR